MQSIRFWLTGLYLIAVMTVSLCAQTDSDKNLTPEERHKLGGKRAPETAQLFEAHTYISAGADTLHYRLLKPLGYDPGKQYPLVVCLSGSGGRGTDNIKQIAGCWPSQILSSSENRETYPCFLLVPQCPPGYNWGRSLGRSRPETSTRSGKSLPQRSGTYALVLDLISRIEAENSIDVSRRYVTGQSMGGAGTWHLIITQPNMFAAAVPICGFASPTYGERIAQIPVWAFHGAEDKTVPVKYSREMIDAMKAAGGSPRYTEFPNAGHVSWPLAYDTPGLLNWLFAQKRNASSK